MTVIPLRQGAAHDGRHQMAQDERWAKFPLQHIIGGGSAEAEISVLFRVFHEKQHTLERNSW